MLQYTTLDTAHVNTLKQTDDNGQSPERTISGGTGTPCRHCLRDVPKGAEMLVLSLRPFTSLHAYAEQGPIFLCADACTAHDPAQIPAVLNTSPDYLVKGYTADERIRYGTGAIVPAADIPAYAETLFTTPEVAYIHVRSARNNCYLCRIDRA